MTVIEEIAAERNRQIISEGWTEDHDDRHGDKSLAAAAATYACLASLHDDYRAHQIDRMHYGEPGIFPVIRALWPASWARSWFKPKDRRRDLIRAGALIVAEIERLDRAAPISSTEAA